MADDHEADPDERREFTVERRLMLLERDVRSHARSLTVLTESIVDLGSSFSETQLDQLQNAVATAFSSVGLRIDDADHIDGNREDFRFLRRSREWWDSAVNKTGTIVLIAVIGLVVTIFSAGFWAWLNRGGH